MRIHQPQGAHGQHAGGHRHLEGQKHQHQHHEKQRIPSPEPEAAQRVGKHGDHQGLSQQDSQRIVSRVEKQRQVQRLFKQQGIVLPKGRDRGRQQDIHPLILRVAVARIKIGLHLSRREEAVKKSQHDRREQQRAHDDQYSVADDSA
ncbi:hypothetical protein SDC9_209350 [bioreactor metagenome]|uniref:Uncharacterized protein n=1 Tax=bioreactor metagenome TaxID=1076179 RepID=A0A645JEL2_9ZZZZ